MARLLGVANLHRGVIESDGWIVAGGVRIAASTGELGPAETQVLWSIRPERVSLPDSGGISGTVSDVVDVGTVVDLFILTAAGMEIHARTTDSGGFEVGGPCQLELPSEAISVWPYEPSQSDLVGRQAEQGFDQDFAVISIPTFVAFTTASAIIPGSSSSSSAASRVINATKRWGPDCTST